MSDGPAPAQRSGKPRPAWLKLTQPDPALNWYERLERSGRLAIGTTLFTVIAIIAASSLRLNWSYDVYWHLQMGRDWIVHGMSPWIDHYSFTFAGAEIRSPPILFQAGLHFLAEAVGLETALKLYKFLALSLTLGLAALWLRRVRAPVVAYVVVLPLMGLLLQVRVIERPELVGFALLVLGAILYQRALELGRMSANAMLPIIALMIFWTNYHGAVLGYVLFFGLFVDFALKQWHERAEMAAWVRWGAWGLMILAAGFARPYFGHPVIEMLAFSNEWKTLISEYLPPVRLLTVPAIYPVVVICIATLWLLLRQKRYGYLIVSLVFLYNAVTTGRMVPPAGLLVLCFFGLALRDAQPGTWIARLPRWQSSLCQAAVWITLTGALVSSVLSARSFIRDNTEARARFPSHLASYVRDSGLTGHVFNEYQLGGYLIYALEGSVKVYIDGRTAILYPVDHFQRYEEVFRSLDLLRAEFDRYDIEFAVFANHAELAKLMLDAGVMGLDFVDLQYSLYRADSPHLPVTGYVWAEPACWNPDLADALRTEKEWAIINLPPASPIFRVFELLDRFNASGTAETLDATLASAQGDDAFGLRFVAYRALELRAYELATAAFEALSHRRHTDLLAGASAYIELGQYAEAEAYLDTATRSRVKVIHPNDLVILHRSLRAIQDAGHLTKFDLAYLDGLEEEVRKLNPAGTGDHAAAGDFCTAELPGIGAPAGRETTAISDTPNGSATRPSK